MVECESDHAFRWITYIPAPISILPFRSELNTVRSRSFSVVTFDVLRRFCYSFPLCKVRTSHYNRKYSNERPENWEIGFIFFIVVIVATSATVLWLLSPSSSFKWKMTIAKNLRVFEIDFRLLHAMSYKHHLSCDADDHENERTSSKHIQSFERKERHMTDNTYSNF